LSLLVMDFFEAQDRARRKTALLVFYFVLAVVLMIAALYGAAVFVLGQGQAASAGAAARSGDIAIDWLQPGLLAAVSGIVLLVILAGSGAKFAELRAGGEHVAAQLGGRRLDPNSRDPAERRILNVVEEMAIASGVAVPPVYVLRKEPGINAFAAGFTPDDAVIGINQGTLDYLTRDELQGVIAHEFSHILNGDMRFNLRLIGVLQGILLLSIIGYYALRIGGSVRRSNRDDKGGGAFAVILLLGLAAWIIGSIGLLFGRLIKAAVSRQREYLADASAVQFTRNPAGIAGALKKIGGLSAHSFVRSPEAETASHMFFGSAFKRMAYSPFATHPPLTERIQRIDASFQGAFPRTRPLEQGRADIAAPSTTPSAPSTPQMPWDRILPGGRLPLEPALAVAAVGAPGTDDVAWSRHVLQQVPPALQTAARDAFSARALVFALLLDQDDEVRRRQIGLVEKLAGPPTRREVEKLSGPLRDLDPAARLPLVELAQGTLRELSPGQYREFRGAVTALAHADQQISLFEFVLHRLLVKHLDRTFRKSAPTRVRYHKAAAIRDEAALVISTLAHLGRMDAQQTQAVFRQAMRMIRDQGPAELLDRKDCSLAGIDRALDRLAACSPTLKQRLLRAATHCVAADGQVMAGEAELLRVIAGSLDCPMPPIHSLARRKAPAAAPPV
jgi:Zn-dependent protease with chaperone function